MTGATYNKNFYHNMKKILHPQFLTVTYIENFTENEGFFPPLSAWVMSCLKMDHNHYFLPIHQSINQYYTRSKYILHGIVYRFIQEVVTQQKIYAYHSHKVMYASKTTH